MGRFGANPPKNECTMIYLESKNLHGHTALNSVKKIKAMENKSTNPSKGGKSGKIPPKRGQVMSKIFERLKGAVLPKNSKGRVKTSTDEGGSGSGSGSGSGNGAAVAVEVEISNNACIFDETND
ncbi:hypothetical protein CK203_114962 [Vitis vinifera]|uniref:Uncharacterized protein n=1 Tax=Vitis vinifera TaxID=29760 RepID=A0A438E0A7_VITVI|nr:hypothetical protein CK203_114962 [Vitis vinifera]